MPSDIDYRMVTLPKGISVFQSVVLVWVALGISALVAPQVRGSSDVTYEMVFNIITLTTCLIHGIPLAVIDIKSRRLPNKIVLSMLLQLGLFMTIFAAFTGSWARLGQALLGAIIITSFFFLMGMFAHLGFGDVKLSFPLALWAAWYDWTTLAAAFLFFSLFLIPTLILQKGSNQRDGITSATSTLVAPFGPALIAGPTVAVIGSIVMS